MREPAYSAEIAQVIAEQVIASRIGTNDPITPASPVDNSIPLVVIEEEAAKTRPRSSSVVWRMMIGVPNACKPVKPAPFTQNANIATYTFGANP